MSMVPFDNKYRRAWMFPRNIRSIYPWKITQILSVLATQIQSEDWSGNQDLQNIFSSQLEALNLKKNYEKYDPRSGGARTYFAQLEGLGLVFKREDKSVWLTIAGEDLVEGNFSPSLILRTLLLNYQYPSVYGQKRNVKIHPRIQVKPFLFILQLLKHPAIETLSDKEIVIPVLYGHNHDALKLCVSKILLYRDSGDLLSVIDNPDEDLFTPRTVGREYKAALKDFQDVANTCKNYLDSCSLVISDKINGETRIAINSGVLPEIEVALTKVDKFIRVASEESFQRSFGAWNRTKDTRRLTPEYKAGKVSHGEPIVHAQFAEYAGKNLVLDTPDNFIDDMVRMGFERDFIIKTIQPYLINTLSLFEQKFLELSIGGRKTANDFEKAVKDLFEKRLGYEAYHTGQRYRKGEIGGFTDIFLKEKDHRFCAIIDTKASPKYDLSAAHYHTMVNSYIPSLSKIDEYDNEPLSFCAYIAGGFVNSIDKQIKKASDESGYNFTAIQAYDLLELCKLGINDQHKITEVFMSKRFLHSSDFKPSADKVKQASQNEYPVNKTGNDLLVADKSEKYNNQ